MSSSDSRPPVVVVTGPTASGKTPVAIALARRFGAEIVSADSMQVYRYMDIGTAKPSLAERAQVPHAMIDVALPNEIFSAGRYGPEARRAAAQMHARGIPVLLVGGTGLYIRAFLEGLVEGGAANTALRERLEREHRVAIAQNDPGRLHRQLAARDPAAAERIHPNDLRRVVRALELCDRFGDASLAVRVATAGSGCPYRVLHLALDPGRAVLDARIDARCAAMIEAGLLREVRSLREMRFGPELRSMQAIGYRHLQPVYEGRDTLVNALASMQRDTRQFARRQRTWLRGVSDLRWMHPDDVDAVMVAVERFLTESRLPAHDRA